MKPHTLNQLATWTNGTLFKGASAATFTRLITDTRQIQPGDVFVALRGDRFDGHNYIVQAAGKGAVAALVARDFNCDSILAELPAEFGIVQVGDTLTGFQQFATNYRKSLPVELIAVTGSSGKTSTKQLVAAVLQSRFKSAATVGNLNNHIGVPMTLLTLEDDHQFGVIEMGMNHPGEIAPLVNMALPKIGVITNIGLSHIEHFADRAGIAQEKSEVIAHLPADGLAILDATDTWSVKIAHRASCRVVWVAAQIKDVEFELSSGIVPEWRATRVETTEKGVRFELDKMSSNESITVTLPVFSRVMVKNALFAAAIGDACGMTMSEIARGLESVSLPGARMNIVTKPNGITLINDAYNANPDSMRAALDALMEYPKSTRCLAVLGSMGELGQHATVLHHEVGAYAGKLPLAGLVLVGPSADLLKTGAEAGGGILPTISIARDSQEALGAITAMAKPGDTILIKGSHFMALEKIAEQWPAAQTGE